jgi:hypothetical protein
MAIGRVGSFATVEPALVDFGSMTERNIDKIKAEEEAKKLAKAKEAQAKREALKDYKIPDKLGFTGIAEFDRSAQGTFKNLYTQATEAKLIGDERTLLEATGTMNTLISRYDELKELMPNIAKRIESDKTLDDDAGNDHLRDLTMLRDNDYVINTEDPRNIKIALVGEDGKLQQEQLLDDFLGTFKVIPNKIVLIDETKKVIDTIKPSEIESGSYSVNKKITDINSKESQPQVRAIEKNVDTWVSNDNFMYSWYKTKRAQDKSLPNKTTNWTEDQRKEAKEFYMNSLIESYNKEVEMGFGSTGGSGGGPKETPSVTAIVEPVVAGTIGFNDSVDKLFRNGGYSRPIFKGDKGNVKVSGLDLTNVMVNKNGNIVFVLEQPIGSSTGLGGASESNKEAGNTYITASDKGFRIAREKVKNLLGLKTDKELASWVSGGELKFNSNNNNNNSSEAEQRGL